VKLAYIFPGQASQFVGMGKDLWDRYPQVREHYERTNEILGMDIAQLSFQGPEEELVQTDNTQPAIFAHSLALYLLLKEEGLIPHMVAGHSLGEYSALVAAGALPYEETLRLVQLRGRLMKSAGQNWPGTMAAIIGLTSQQVEEICDQVAEVVQLANHNSPTQLVISGEVAGVQRAMELAKEAGAKRAVQLPVSGAFHSPLMEDARERLGEALNRAQFRVPEIPLVANVTAREIEDVDQVKDLLIRQLTSPVLWSDSVERMAEMGAEVFVEVGPGKVLRGLIRRIAPDIRTLGVDGVENLEAVSADLLGDATGSSPAEDGT
jgi:[acyl-carrier-protein] S-malonyltransferase